MSASDYTHLRRVRHVYQPCGPTHQHMNTVQYGNPYSHHHVTAPMQMPYPGHYHAPAPAMMPPQPIVMHPPTYPSCPPPMHHHDLYHDPYGYHYPEHLYLGSYPPSYPQYHEPVVTHRHPSPCQPVPTVIDSSYDPHQHHHHPPHHLDHHHDAAYEHGHDLGVRHGNTYIHHHGDDIEHHHHHVGHKHRATGPSSSTRYQYLITPAVNGSVTFTIDPNLSFKKDMRISVTSDLSSNNYFEGNVYSYNPCNGEITIYKIATVNGTFNKPSKYTISFGASFQEFDKLKLRTAELELKVFGSTNLDPSGNVIADPSGNLTDAELTKANTDVMNLYKYFFNEDISEEEDYVKTEGYLTLKINTLYNYFFDVNIVSDTAFNPNNNGVVLDTLPKKIAQMNYYFFGNIEPSLNV